MFLINCNNVRNKTPLLEKQEVKKELKNIVLGKWISINHFQVSDIFISNSNSNSNSNSKTYNIKIVHDDGFFFNDSLKLNNKGEYHINNKSGEYYKILSNNYLGFYDNKGLRARYQR